MNSGMTKLALHRTFGISRSTLDNWLVLRKQQGHVAPARPLDRTSEGFFDSAKFDAFARVHCQAARGQMRVA